MTSKEQMRNLLFEVYEEHGPRDKGGIVPPDTFAKMSRAAVDVMWDFDGRHLMHRIAKAIAPGSRTR